MAIRITYNSVNVDLNIGSGGIDVVFMEKNFQERSASGKIETLNIFNFGEAITFDATFLEAVYRQLIAWQAWAEQGKAFSFAMDSSLTVDTTLDAAAAAAQTTIPLTATAGLSVDDVCFIRSADRTKYEICVIASISAGVSVVVDDNLIYTYASGDTFRHWHYWPDVVIPEGEKFNPPKSGPNYRHTFRFFEDL